MLLRHIIKTKALESTQNYYLYQSVHVYTYTCLEREITQFPSVLPIAKSKISNKWHSTSYQLLAYSKTSTHSCKAHSYAVNVHGIATPSVRLCSNNSSCHMCSIGGNAKLRRRRVKFPGTLSRLFNFSYSYACHLPKRMIIILNPRREDENCVHFICSLHIWYTNVCIL